MSDSFEMKTIKTLLVGAVEYTISSAEVGVATARYVSSGSMVMGAGTICNGRAEGDFSNGFAGQHLIRYYDVNGDLGGEYDWHIESVGDCFLIKWYSRSDEDRLAAKGELVFEGFGFSNSERSIVASYWFAEPVSERIAQALR
ncbi:hypothetical protein Ga0074812_12689 [Parafrankia irregularis]|uniref:Uncharacterized protein n=1 Tax=Parafrankia irregularis TaxID=795642 RepID=A0A0S4QUN4_9ACTN|nr:MULTISPECIES: hypothetical protein [Parafrankia]MBE3199944.1 hypothetical protein [Parafrankia sp. CH37]CUU59312.1 hypothetical protein Ga0074812_12689 [Parafrankia irregularis]